MKDLLRGIRAALAATVVLALACCGAYPLAVTGLARVCFPERAAGSLVVAGDGTVRGSTLIGQGFAAAHYFHPRPSAAGTGYDATASGGSNLGPTSRKLADSIAANVAAYRAENELGTNAPVPADAVTSSASGLDPHIGPANAELQVARVAKARGLAPERVRKFVLESTETPVPRFLGEPGVNVLRLNLALDRL